MNSRGSCGKLSLSKCKWGLALQAFCLIGALQADETRPVQGGSQSPDLRSTQNWHSQIKSPKESNFKLGYGVDLFLDRKLKSPNSNSPLSFSKARGVFHGPKLSFESDPISGFVKLGRASYAFKHADPKTYRGLGMGLGGRVTLYDQDDVSVAIELAYFRGRASSKRIFTKSPKSTGREYLEDDLIEIPGIKNQTIYNEGVMNFGDIHLPTMKSNEAGQLLDFNGNQIGRKIGNDWFIRKSELKNSPQKLAAQQEQARFSQSKHPTKLKQSSMAARVIAKKQMGNFSPYIGLGYLADRTTFYSTGGEWGREKIVCLKAKNKNKIGPIIGCTFANNGKIHLGFEGQLISQRSISLSGSYQF